MQRLRSPPKAPRGIFQAFGVRAELFAGNQGNEYLMVGGAMVGARFTGMSDILCKRPL